MLLRRVLRRHLVRVSRETGVLGRVLRRGCVTEDAKKVLRRQKHALSQSMIPFACTLHREANTLFFRSDLALQA